MTCPKCGSIINEKNICLQCNKNIKDIYMKMSENSQVKREYETALIYLEKALEYATDEEDKEDIEKLIKNVQFSRFEEKESQDIFEGIIGESNEKKIKNEDYIYSGFKKLFFISLFLIFLVGAFEFGRNFYFKNKKISDSIINDRTLKTAFLFHFNQGHYPNADIADKASYNRLLKTLRKHKNLKFNIHISGTLIQDMLWYNPETIDLIKEGVKEGQFELLGSTYSQNLLYSTDDISNRWQIERHKEILKDVFDVEPLGFWNAERTWTQNIAELIGEFGYKYTFVEDHILKKSGSSFPEYILRSTNNAKLIIINDDYEFMPYFNNAVDTGDNEGPKDNWGAHLTKDSANYKSIFGYMRKIYEQDKNADFLLNYAEDAEAVGLWDLRDGYTPLYDFENLDFLLNEISSKKWIETVTYSEYLSKNQPTENIDLIVDGAAKWMNNAARGIGFYSEKGYTSWFDFNTNSPKLNYYRKEHIKYRDMIIKYENNENPIIKTLIQAAKEIYLSKQYEFGCTGISGTDEDWRYNRKYEAWENIKLVNVIMDIIKNIENYNETIYEYDVNNDEIKEIVVVNNYNYYVFSKARGGRLLYWYDLNTGHQIVGGELGTNHNYPYFDDNVLLLNFDYNEYLRFMSPEPELDEYLSNKKLNVRMKALNEISYKTETNNDSNDVISENIYNFEMNYKIDDENNLYFVSGDFIKKINFTENGIEINYDFSDTIKYIEIMSEFQPGYYSIANKGKEILEINDSDKIYDIYNKNDNIGLKIDYSDSFQNLKEEETFMGVMIKVYLETGKKINIEKYKK